MSKGMSITVSKDGNIRVQRDCTIDNHAFIVATMGETYFSSCFAEECPNCKVLEERIEKIMDCCKKFIANE